MYLTEAQNKIDDLNIWLVVMEIYNAKENRQYTVFIN